MLRYTENMSSVSDSAKSKSKSKSKSESESESETKSESDTKSENERERKRQRYVALYTHISKQIVVHKYKRTTYLPANLSTHLQ